MSSPSPDPSFSSMARFVVFFSCSRATVMKVEMSSECTKVKATWQGHKSHLWCKWFLCILLLSISSYDHTTIHSRLASRHIYTLLPRSIMKRKLLLPLCARTYTNIQFPKWMKKNLPTQWLKILQEWSYSAPVEPFFHGLLVESQKCMKREKRG